MRPIAEVASDLGFDPVELEPAGLGVLRIPVALVRSRAAAATRGRLILVTAMTPTEHGEGKTVTSIGLGMALRRRGHRSVVCLRQPSLGPVFGAKGGASGGGRSTVEPRPAIDLGFTGDLDALTNAQNLLVTLVDQHLFQGNRLGIDPARPTLPRASPLEDRALRDIQSGLTVKAAGFPRPGQFVITPAWRDGRDPRARERVRRPEGADRPDDRRPDRRRRPDPVDRDRLDRERRQPPAERPPAEPRADPGGVGGARPRRPLRERRPRYVQSPLDRGGPGVVRLLRRRGRLLHRPRDGEVRGHRLPREPASRPTPPCSWRPFGRFAGTALRAPKAPPSSADCPTWSSTSRTSGKAGWSPSSR